MIQNQDDMTPYQRQVWDALLAEYPEDLRAASREFDEAHEEYALAGEGYNDAVFSSDQYSSDPEIRNAAIQRRNAAIERDTAAQQRFTEARKNLEVVAKRHERMLRRHERILTRLFFPR